MTPTGRRWLAPLGVVTAVMAVLTPGLPAAAQEPQAVKLSVALPNVTIAPGTGGRTTGIMVWADVSHETTLRHFRFAIDSAGLNGATVEPFTDAGCTTAGTVKTCDSRLDPTVTDTAVGADLINIRPTAGATLGQHGTVKLTASADNATAATVTATVRIGEAVDLANVADVTVESRPGGSVTAPLAVRNAGTTSAQGVELQLFQDYAAKLARRYTNCEYDDDYAVCHFDTTLAPGGEYALSEQLPILIGSDAWAPGELSVEFEWLTPADRDAWSEGVPQPRLTRGTGGKLTLTDRKPTARAEALSQTDPRSQDNGGAVTIKISGDNQADFAALGATARGEVGAVVTVDLGVRNAGPASASYRSAGPVQIVQVDVPDGATAVSVSSDCIPYVAGSQVFEHRGQPGWTRYWCHTGSRFLAGTTSSWRFGLRIDKKLTNAVGAVTININYQDPNSPRHDTNPTNDTASLMINPTNDANGGTAILPVTGGHTGFLLNTAFALLAAGAVLFLLGRMLADQEG